MKKIFFIAFCLVLFSACFKVKPIPTPLDATVPCSIEKVISHIYGSEYDTFYFAYNAAGNPLSITHRIGYGNGDNYFFRYDQYNRLTDYYDNYIGNDSTVGGDWWMHYVYNSPNSVFPDIDSEYDQYYGPPTTQSPSSYEQVGVWYYQYDAQNRMTNRTFIMPDFYNPFTYSYDAKGNVIDSTVKYDNEVNIHRTNKWFQFVDCQFSANNPSTDISSYNSEGLPVTFTGGPGGIAGSEWGPATVTYSCK